MVDSTFKIIDTNVQEYREAELAVRVITTAESTKKGIVR